MRFRSARGGGGQVFAVSGVNTISFAVVAGKQLRKDLLGFAVERIDAEENEQFFITGFKVFRSLIPEPDVKTVVSTFDHPVQSFLWDDFTAKPDRTYEYRFHPLKGTPKNLDRTAPPLAITVRTEPLFSDSEHDVFFNRGVASSQAFQRRFGDTRIDDRSASEQKRALDWLSRDLDDALLRFIRSCPKGDRLLCCFYEFRFQPVVDALHAAIRRGVDVRIIVDAKVNERTDKKGKFHPSFPREENLGMIADKGIGDRVTLREARKSAIAHNKFMVRLERGQKPVEVWTGSTNISRGGISGQTNVGHWVRNEAVAAGFAAYWDLLATDPGGRKGDPKAKVEAKNLAFKTAVEELSPVPADLSRLPRGTTVVFSPRRDASVLESYAGLLDTADDVGCITLAFGISPVFKKFLQDNTDQNALVFMLLETRDKPDPDSEKPFVVINASNNVYKAFGSFIREPVHQFAVETNAGLLGLNQHVSFIHSKFMLVDPLGADPLVITGSANFSDKSTEENDENMLVIRGDRRATDIYFTEFNRLFNHYYFRSVAGSPRAARREDGGPSVFLAEKPAEWQDKYAPGTFKTKRLDAYAAMNGFSRV